MVNIESVPSEAGPDLDGIEQGISNNEVEIGASGNPQRCWGLSIFELASPSTSLRAKGYLCSQ